MLDFRAVLFIAGLALVCAGCRGAPVATTQNAPAPAVVPTMPGEPGANLTVAPTAPSQPDPGLTVAGQACSRAEVERVLGAPITTLDTPDGRWHTYRVAQANAGGGDTPDVVQLGPWTVAAAPDGHANAGKIKVMYDAETDRTNLVRKAD